MTENVKENTPIIRVKELEKYFLAKRGYIHMSQYVKAVDGISLDVMEGETVGLVGESGCGKSTTAGIIMGHMKNYTGNVTIGGNSLSQISEASLMKHITYVGHNSYLFKGTVRQNLLMGSPDAKDDISGPICES